MASSEVLVEGKLVERMRDLESRVRDVQRDELRLSLSTLTATLSGMPRDGPAVNAALSLCRTLHGHARSGEALALARSALEAARHLDEPALIRRAASACGILCADSLDLVGAIEYHVLALRTALGTGDVSAACRVWNGIAVALGIGGDYQSACHCYRRSLRLMEPISERLYPRYVALSNLAICLHRVGEPEWGLPMALRALEEETPAILAEDPGAALNLRRNLVTLLVACGRWREAEPHVAECTTWSERIRTPRASIAESLTRATYDLARGSTDVALTRLEHAIGRAREMPAALRDALAAAVHAEEAAGNAERALMRMNELSDHVYRDAIARAREHVELSVIPGDCETRSQAALAQARSRLVDQVLPPSPPDEWPAFERLAVNAVLPMDRTGCHGKRVGALVKALALAHGEEPLRALEMGLAAELHDIGMLSVPHALLRKSDTLNEAERVIVRRHVDAGVEMLLAERHPRLFLARDIARYHHARWDGDGEPPAGGNRIPLAARVASVADAYDAMVFGLGTGRPRTMDDALSQLRQEAGGQFDPALVDSFDTLVRSASADLGMDFAAGPGMVEFQSLINALQDDRGFV
jgi:putative two-component system response regulator